MDVPKSIAIIGEGETEWFYFESLRVACRYPFRIAPDMPQHSDITHMAKMAEQCVAKDYDIVICLVDMDRLFSNKKELNAYIRIKDSSNSKIMWIETNPCTEFWFLLHFIPDLVVRQYQTCDEVMAELQKYMPGYEKTTRYFRKIKLYEFLRANGDIKRAIRYAEQLSSLSESSPEDKIAYSQIHHVLTLLGQWSIANKQEEEIKTDNSERIGEVEMKIIDFLTNSPDSDVKSISKAIDLRQSRTSDYIKRLIRDGKIEATGGWRKTYRLKKDGTIPNHITTYKS